MQPIRVGAVSYLNTKPLLWGLERGAVRADVELKLLYPAQLAAGLKDGLLDLALMPVAALPGIPGARVVGEWGIGADGPVASVCLFSEVPMANIARVFLDYQSRTSIRLAQWLLQHFWKQPVAYVDAPEDYIGRIRGTTAGVIIGDRALQAAPAFPYVYDLAEAWKAATGLPFVFAGWAATRDFPEDFLAAFNAANAEGMKHLAEIVAANPFPAYDLMQYYTQNIRYRLDAPMMEGMDQFLTEMRGMEEMKGRKEMK